MFFELLPQSRPVFSDIRWPLDREVPFLEWEKGNEPMQRSGPGELYSGPIGARKRFPAAQASIADAAEIPLSGNRP